MHEKPIISKRIIYDSQWDDLAIALKTGKEVALQRVPIQLLTFLADVRNKIIIGDDNVTIGEYAMINVVSDLYSQSEKSIIKRNTAFSNIQDLLCLPTL